jgi:hypothetical protein
MKQAIGRRRCEFFQEGGGDPGDGSNCLDHVTTAIRIKISHDGRTWEDLLYSCDKHAMEYEKNLGFISKEPI